MAQVKRLGIGDAADYSGMSRATLRRYVQRGQLPAEVTPTGQLRFRPADLDALLKPAPTGGVPLKQFANEQWGTS